MTTLDTPTVTATALTATTGSVLSGVRLGGDLPAGTVAAIREQLLARKVVFFRGQDHLDLDGQLAFAHLLGDLTTAHPTVPGARESQHVLPIDSEASRADSWHTDVTFVERPPAFTVLRAVTLPPVGGDTVWANTTSAYERLPQPLKHLADSLRAVHTNQHDYARPARSGSEGGQKERQYHDQFVAEVFETEHPVVRVHPETGERTLLLGGFVRSFRHLGSSESAALLDLFQQRVTLPENQVRWSWQPGDVAIWDNRATQHYAVNDYGRADRQLTRVTVAGDVPVGPDGTPSRVLRGDASGYTPAS
ncbi:TauD/TfdA family dioxygenase [Kineococcus glutinatus]|uniref:TauD/TfdA family dioxygenase n=1 Tax=Kineococcus glutinatus TaxID=1070872 RepID=A0ABP9H478_9ACTN